MAISFASRKREPRDYVTPFIPSEARDITVHEENRQDKRGSATYMTASPMYYTYILESLKDGSFYVGFTIDLKSRLEKHNKGEVISTKSRPPFELIHYEAFINEKDAKDREQYLKSGWGLRSVKKLLQNYLRLR